MHFHLPKPLHGWREFADEVGIIVIGVLIALGAEEVDLFECLLLTKREPQGSCPSMASLVRLLAP